MATIKDGKWQQIEDSQVDADQSQEKEQVAESLPAHLFPYVDDADRSSEVLGSNLTDEKGLEGQKNPSRPGDRLLPALHARFQHISAHQESV